jgi:hypothetical protein
LATARLSEDLGGRLVIEASQAGSIVVGDEGVEVGAAFGMVAETAVVRGAVLRQEVEMLAEPAGLSARPCPCSAAGTVG